MVVLPNSSEEEKEVDKTSSNPMKQAVEDKVRTIIAKQLDIRDERATTEEAFNNLDRNSLFSDDHFNILEIMMAIEDEFGFEIPVDDEEKIRTIGDYVSYILRKKPQKYEKIDPMDQAMREALKSVERIEEEQRRERESSWGTEKWMKIEWELEDKARENSALKAELTAKKEEAEKLKEKLKKQQSQKEQSTRNKNGSSHDRAINALGLDDSINLTKISIKKAYRLRVEFSHPDRFQHSANPELLHLAEEKMKELNNARDLLLKSL